MQKKILFTGAMLMLAVVPLNYVSAKKHWKPLDPSTYWNPAVIDHADTNNPGHYFYHDLGKSGGTVIDHPRSEQEELKTQKFKIWKEILDKLFGLVQDETKHMDTGKAKELENKHQQVRETLRNTPLINTVDDAPVDFIYEDTDTPILKSKDNPRKWAAQAYKKLNEQLVEQSRVIDQLSEDLTLALKTLDSAQSEVEIQQAAAHIKALRTEAMAHFSAYMQVRAQLKGIKERTEAAERELDRNQVHYQTFGLDPIGNESDKAAVEHYQKTLGVEFYKPKGMPSF